MKIAHKLSTRIHVRMYEKSHTIYPRVNHSAAGKLSSLTALAVPVHVGKGWLCPTRFQVRKIYETKQMKRAKLL
jgi:hypothetical protein